MKTSLSKYFPKDTEYFYSFPAGEESDFFNDVPAWKEELVAARPFVCAGSNVKIVAFASSTHERVWNLLKELGLPLIKKENIYSLPEEINADVKGRKRNRLIKGALSNIASRHKFIMAQPLLSDPLRFAYAIPPELSIWCNDKKHMPSYIPPAFVPKRYKTFPDGKTFFENASDSIPLPCVVKVSSSSSGNGVRICRSQGAFEQAKKKFKRIRGSIFIEEYINAEYNLGIQFAIPYDKKKPIEIIGVNEQLTSNEGEYLGAIIDQTRKLPQVNQINEFLRDSILPSIREKGWYGTGGFDVLIDKDGRFYFIDCNFRMTAMTAYLFLMNSGFLKKSIATFTGCFKGTEESLREIILPMAKRGRRQQMQIIAMTDVGNEYHFNAAMFFDKRDQIPERCQALLKLGITSTVLKRLSRLKK